MSEMMEILKTLTPLNRVICSSDYDWTIDFLKGVLQFKVIEYNASDEYNGWVIPPKWDVKVATISKNGEVVYDGKEHPLGVIALSNCFNGSVDRDELRNHLHFDHRFGDALPFHYRQQYRSWNRDWGFCVPRIFIDELKPGSYDVIIQTEEAHGILKVLEYTHQGTLGETIIVGGNLDHPGVANDGIAGCVVGIELFRRLANRNTKYSYRLVLSPGIIGSEYYLGNLDSAERARLFEGVFLEMLGTDSQLALQESRTGVSTMDCALRHALNSSACSHRRGPFESIIVNDEYIWENHCIPMTSLSRFPYPEYHSSRDNDSIIRQNSLDESLEVLLKAIDIIEESRLVEKQFEGNVCLSNPKYDLYTDYGQVALGDSLSDERSKMRILMDLIPSLKKPTTTLALSEQVGLPDQTVAEYLERWAAKGLVRIR